MDKNTCSGVPLKALIVDDEPVVLSVIERVLTDEGFLVDRALSGEAALELFKAGTYSVVVSDVYMGGMSGFELIKAVSAMDEALKSVVITEHDSYEIVRTALKINAYDYLVKPLDDHEAISLCVHRAAQATQLIRGNLELVDQLRSSHALLEQANQQYRLLNEELRIQANTDSLTEIYNRRFIDHTLLQEVNRSNRYHEPLSVVMVDIDHFKAFNDHHGHEGGDIVLKFVARLLEDCSRNIDVVGRHGGEEFFIILPCTSPSEAMVYAERMRKKVCEHRVELRSSRGQVTISAGVAGIGSLHPPIEVAALVNAADRALYRAKRMGRNRCCMESGIGSATEIRD